MEIRLRAPVTRGYFFSSALRASLTRLRREISIRKKYPLEPRVGHLGNTWQGGTKTTKIFVRICQDQGFTGRVRSGTHSSVSISVLNAGALATQA